MSDKTLGVPSYSKYVFANDGLTNDTIAYGVVDIKTGKETNDWSGDKLAAYSFIEKNLKILTGRILTIIDASIPEGRQNKCIKDLIRCQFMEEFTKIGDLMFDKQRLERICDEAEVIEHSMSSEEILGA